jgi:hypothetical protein
MIQMMIQLKKILILIAVVYHEMEEARLSRVLQERSYQSLANHLVAQEISVMFDMANWSC